jgi:hypothetical protein
MSVPTPSSQLPPPVPPSVPTSVPPSVPTPVDSRMALALAEANAGTSRRRAPLWAIVPAAVSIGFLVGDFVATLLFMIFDNHRSGLPKILSFILAPLTYRFFQIPRASREPFDAAFLIVGPILVAFILPVLLFTGGGTYETVSKQKKVVSRTRPDGQPTFVDSFARLLALLIIRQMDRTTSSKPTDDETEKSND